MKHLILVIFALTLLLPSSGQKTISTLSLQLSFPQEEYKETYDVTGVGVRWNILTRPNVNVPISIGGELGFLINGSSSRVFDVFFLGFYDRYRVTAANNIISLAFKTRADLISHEKAVQLYVDGTVGTNLFFSSVEVTRETFFGQSDYAGGNSSKGYWAFVWGPGLGIEIPVSKDRQTAISVKGSYLFGSNTKYFTDPYINNNGEVFFTQRESKTTMLLIEGGVRFGMMSKKRARR